MGAGLILGGIFAGVFLWLLLMWSPSASADGENPHPVVKYLTKCARRLAILFRTCFLICAVIGFAMMFFATKSDELTAGYIFTGVAGAFLVLTLASSACSKA